MQIKCTDLISLLADYIKHYGDMDVGISILTENTSIDKKLRHCDHVVGDKVLWLTFEIDNIKEFKKKLK